MKIKVKVQNKFDLDEPFLFYEVHQNEQYIIIDLSVFNPTGSFEIICDEIKNESNRKSS